MDMATDLVSEMVITDIILVAIMALVQDSFAKLNELGNYLFLKFELGLLSSIMKIQK